MTSTPNRLTLSVNVGDGMAGRKSKQRAPWVPPPPREPDRPHCAWYTDAHDTSHRVRCVPYTERLQHLAETEYLLPPYQRGVVWSREKQLTYLQTVWRGLPTAPCVIWRRRVPYSLQGQLWIMDGQQRLTALGANIRRADGTHNEPPIFRLDIPTGTWSLDGPGEPWALCSLAQANMLERPAWKDRGLPVSHDLIHHPLQCYARAQNAYVQILEIECPDERAAEVFSILAQPGIAWTPEELEGLITSIQDAGLSWMQNVAVGATA